MSVTSSVVGRISSLLPLVVVSLFSFSPLFCLQVLFCYEQFDELTLLHLREFDKKKLISVETDIVVDHYKEEKYQDSKPGKTHLSLTMSLNAAGIYIRGEILASTYVTFSPDHGYQ